MPANIAKVFISGNSQAVRLPKEFRLDVDEVYISKSGDSLVLTPRMNSWEGFVEGFTGFSDDFGVTDGLADEHNTREFARVEGLRLEHWEAG